MARRAARVKVPAPSIQPAWEQRPISGTPAVEVEIRDQYQLEFRFHHTLQHSEEEQCYRLESFLFIPRNVGVNRSNYPRETFYADATALMRLDATPLRIEELSQTSCTSSPLHQLSAAAALFRAEGRPPPSLSLATQVKLYAYMYAGAVHREIGRLREHLGATLRQEPRAADEPPIEAMFTESLGRLREGLWAFRRLRTEFLPFELLAHESFAETMRMADEYMSLFLEEELAPIALLLAERPAHFDGTGSAARSRLTVAKLLREEARYRAKHGYLVVGEDGQLDGEYFTYRRSLLKKVIHEALYLDMRTTSGDGFFKNVIAAVGAALAAIWALLATPLPGKLAQLGGTSQALFFVGAVLAYVMKDRTKALTNEYLTRRLRKYDHVFNVEGASFTSLGLKGLRLRLSEAMSFLRSEEVPSEIRRLRLSQRTVLQSKAPTEEVIRYRKELRVEKRAPSGQKLAETFHVRDIFRLNVRHFLVRLDDPLDPVVYFDARHGSFHTATLPKVYHLNLVLRLERIGLAGRSETRLERIRVVINKHGIVRVDPIESAGPLTLPPTGSVAPPALAQESPE